MRVICVTYNKAYFT